MSYTTYNPDFTTGTPVYPYDGPAVSPNSDVITSSSITVNQVDGLGAGGLPTLGVNYAGSMGGWGTASYVEVHANLAGNPVANADGGFSVAGFMLSDGPGANTYLSIQIQMNKHLSGAYLQNDEAYVSTYIRQGGSGAGGTSATFTIGLDRSDIVLRVEESAGSFLFYVAGVLVNTIGKTHTSEWESTPFTLNANTGLTNYGATITSRSVSVGSPTFYSLDIPPVLYEVDKYLSIEWNTLVLPPPPPGSSSGTVYTPNITGTTGGVSSAFSTPGTH